VKKTAILILFLLSTFTLTSCESSSSDGVDNTFTNIPDGLQYIVKTPIITEYINLEYIDLEYINLIELELINSVEKYPELEYIDTLDAYYVTSESFLSYLNETDVQDFTSQFVDWNQVRNDLAIGGTLLVINFTINSVRFGSPISAAVYLFKDIAIGIVFDFIFDALPKILDGADPTKATIESIAAGFKYGMIFEIASTGVASIFSHIQAVRIAMQFANTIPDIKASDILSLSKHINNKASLIKEIGEATAERLLKNTDLIVKAAKIAPSPVRAIKMKSIISEYTTANISDNLVSRSEIKLVIDKMLNGVQFTKMIDDGVIAREAIDFVMRNQDQVFNTIKSITQKYGINSYVNKSLKGVYETHMTNVLGKDIADKVLKGTFSLDDFSKLSQIQKDTLSKIISSDVTSSQNIIELARQVQLYDFVQRDEIAPFRDDLLTCTTNRIFVCKAANYDQFIEYLQVNKELSDQFLKIIDTPALEKNFSEISHEISKSIFRTKLGDEQVAATIFDALNDRKTADQIVNRLRSMYPNNTAADDAISFLLGEKPNINLQSSIIEAIRYSNINSQYLIDLLENTSKKTNLTSLLKFYGNKISKGNILTLLTNPSVDNVNSFLSKINNSRSIAIEQFSRIVNSINFSDVTLTATQLENLRFLQFDSILRTRLRDLDYTSSLISKADYNRLIKELSGAQTNLDSVRNLNIQVYGENIVDIITTQRGASLMFFQNASIGINQNILKDISLDYVHKQASQSLENVSSELFQYLNTRKIRAQRLIDDDTIQKIIEGTLFQNSVSSDVIDAIIEFYPEILPLVTQSNQLIFEEYTTKMVYYRALRTLERFRDIENALYNVDRLNLSIDQIHKLETILETISEFKANTSQNITSRRFATLLKYNIDDYMDMYVEIVFEGRTYYFPNFDRFSKYIAQPINVFDRDADFAAANAISRLSIKPSDYTWHHIEDARNLILIPSDIHQLLSHTGGSSIANVFNLFQEFMMSI
jgi:hypothetical protein